MSLQAAAKFWFLHQDLSATFFHLGEEMCGESALHVSPPGAIESNSSRIIALDLCWFSFL